MKVSVLIISYNHGAFIAQAIDSAVMQLTNFEYEIVIGEDCSTDDTRKTVISYQEKYPDKIRLLLPERNLGLFGKHNFVQTLQACRGQYVALLEGDDYWTSPKKLQKQVDLLESRRDFTICFHNVEALNTETGEVSYVVPADQKEISTLQDLLLADFIPTCSTMFRRGLFSEFPEWFYSIIQGDWPISIFNAQHGSIGYINEVMATYRVHPGGVWSSLGPIANYEDKVKFYKYINQHLNFEYEGIIRPIVSSLCFKLALEHERASDYSSARASAWKCMMNHPLRAEISAGALLRMLGMVYVPRLFKMTRTLRSSINSMLHTAN